MAAINTYDTAGKVVTGFSHLMVAAYAESSGTITYSSGRVASGAVDVSMSPETSDDTIFYHDNQAGESAGGRFTGGTVTFTVKGLNIDAEKLIYGLPTADSAGWTAYGDDQAVPYLGAGFIVRFMSKGNVIYTPYVLAKVKFDQMEVSAATEGEQIDFQAQTLTAQMFRGDDAKHNWRFVGSDWPTETEAITQLNAKLGVS